MSDIKSLAGDADSVVLRITKERSGKYTLHAELCGSDPAEALDSVLVTGNRPLSFLVEELFRAVGNLELALNRGTIRLSTD